MSGWLDALIGLANLAMAAASTKKDIDAAKEKELKQAIDGADKLPPPPKLKEGPRG